MALTWHAGPYSANAAFPVGPDQSRVPGWRAGPHSARAAFARETRASASGSSRFGSVKDFFSTLQSFTLTAAALLGFVAIAIFLFDGIAQEKLIIDGISVPKEMVE